MWLRFDLIVLHLRQVSSFVTVLFKALFVKCEEQKLCEAHWRIVYAFSWYLVTQFNIPERLFTVFSWFHHNLSIWNISSPSSLRLSEYVEWTLFRMIPLLLKNLKASQVLHLSFWLFFCNNCLARSPLTRVKSARLALLHWPSSYFTKIRKTKSKSRLLFNNP